MPRFIGPFTIVKVLSPVAIKQIVPSVALCSPCLSHVLRQTCYPRIVLAVRCQIIVCHVLDVVSPLVVIR